MAVARAPKATAPAARAPQRPVLARRGHRPIPAVPRDVLLLAHAFAAPQHLHGALPLLKRELQRVLLLPLLPRPLVATQLVLRAAMPLEAQLQHLRPTQQINRCARVEEILTPQPTV